MTYSNNHETTNTTGKKVAGIVVGTVAIAAIAAAGLYLVDFDQTKEARLPEVEVSVEEGQMPAYDVEVADVNIESKDVNVDVPTVDVETETKTIEVEVPVDVETGTTEETVTVPTVEIERPEEDDPANNPTQ